MIRTESNWRDVAKDSGKWRDLYLVRNSLRQKM
jgi:hypothetical protein